MRVLDYLLRFAFFAVVPYVATLIAAFFPMTPVIVNVALTLLVFATAESLREHATRRPLLGRLLGRRLAFEEHYRQNPPRPFLFYVFYPVLLPYVLLRADTRKELGLYRGLTGGGLVILLFGAAYDFWAHWLPELRLGTFVWRWALLFGIQTLSIFLFLMPIATTVVKLHLEKRMPALWSLLGVAALSVTVAAATLIRKHGHVVSWVTTQRVLLRTRAEPEGAKVAQIRALRAAWDNLAEVRVSTDKDGWVEGDALDRVEEHLRIFYKADEAYAFSMHAIPPEAPEVLMIQCHLGPKVQPIWRALKHNGEELLSPADMPGGVLGLPRRESRRPPVMRVPGKPAAKPPAPPSAKPPVATSARPPAVLSAKAPPSAAPAHTASALPPHPALVPPSAPSAAPPKRR
jgi:hypothetical protein